MALEHGGRIKAAARATGIPESQWLDLSTGISPWSWPVPPLPEAVWRRLPEDEDYLIQRAREWMAVPDSAAVQALAGSQQAIMQLPRLRRHSRVGVPMPGYREHGHAWRAFGHSVVELTSSEVGDALPGLDVLVWIHPNNPSGEVLPLETLLEWCAQLASRGGWMVVDEAFVEASEADSLVSYAGRPGLIVLRSVGKFFGLAGLRGGFMVGPQSLCTAMAEAVGPWALSGPARWVLEQALVDTDWQAVQARRLKRQAWRLGETLRAKGLAFQGGCDLFQTVKHARPRAIQAVLEGQGILVRAFDEVSWLRFGLPGNEEEMTRLSRALDGA